ncbi:hypothetical protein D0862_10995 [Hortaea werneckii]|uniref:F-box domain-containing protein n=1 Tax=Hortaea werneckii TaxID=91943 RepID=A0A3M7FBY9_HORWE|nr:hypothetical protein D0862_10995 [Hortaea werneckii]
MAYSEGLAVTTAIKRRRRTDFGNSSMITRSQTLSAARNAVLHTTELLENILYFLPMKDLLFAQRVCTEWRELIQRSVPLQEALFLRPRELGVYWRRIKSLDMQYKLVKINKEEFSRGQKGEVFKAAIPNPLLCKIDVFGKSRAKNERPHNAWFKHRPSALYPEACWRNMLIAQGPSCLFEYYFEYQREDRKDPCWTDCRIENIIFPECAKAGNVVGLVEEIEAEGHFVEWDGHVLRFPRLMFTTEEELEIDVVG